MVVLREEGFEHEGHTYRIVVARDVAGLKIRALIGDAPATPFSYHVSAETEVDFATYTGQSAVVHLIEAAKADIREGRTIL